LDGVVYVLPGNSEFEMETMELAVPTKLQESVDTIRRSISADKPMIVFRNRYTSKEDRVNGSQLMLFREATDLPEYRSAFNAARENAVFQDGVAKLDIGKPGSDKPRHTRFYSVQTGLDFAPEADVACDDLSIGTSCNVEIPRPGRHRLRWRWVTVPETTPQSIRSYVRDLIAQTLPRDMEKEAKASRE
jgi:hypothetical protein